MAAGIPSVQVFFGKETAGIDGPVTWVDITTPYVRLEAGLTETRGTSYGGGAQPGSFSLTLDNTDGTFTAGNTGSSLYPYVRLQAPMKILRDGRPWFIGRIQAMPMAWPTGGDSVATVTVTLADKLARYERMMLKSYTVEEIMATTDSGPIKSPAYYPLAEASGATQSLSALTWNFPSTPALLPVAFGTGTVAFGSGGATFTPSAGGGMGLVGKGFPYSPLTIVASFATSSGGLLWRFTTPMGGAAMWEDVSAETYLGVPGIMLRTYFDIGMSGWWFYPRSVLDGSTHAIIVDTSSLMPTAPTVYIDGVALTASAFVTPGVIGSGANGTLYIGAAPPTWVWTPTAFNGTISNVAMWINSLGTSVGRVSAALMNSGAFTTQQAFNRVLGWRNQASTALIDAGVSDNIPTSVLGSGSLASVLSSISASEMGTLYVDGQDRLTWRNRRALPSPSISIPVDDVSPDTAYNCDLTRVQTLVTASIQGGGSVTVASGDYGTVGEVTGSVTSLSTTPGDALAHASWVANTGPRGPYIGSLKIDMATASAATNAAVDTAGILTKVTLTGMPSQTPPGSTVLEVIGETETVSATAWDITWMVLPAGLGSARDVLVLGDATYGVIGSTHLLAY